MSATALFLFPDDPPVVARPSRLCPRGVAGCPRRWGCAGDLWAAARGKAFPRTIPCRRRDKGRYQRRNIIPPPREIAGPFIRQSPVAYLGSIALIAGSNSIIGWANKDQGRDGWLKQVWFAGNHSDIGGSYPENESRLSDISFRWMIDEVTALPSPLLIDKSLLQLSPGPTGMQRDERKSSLVFRFEKSKIRDPKPDAPLHASVRERFLAPAVLQYDEMKPYRSDALRDHVETKQFYGERPLPPPS